MFFKVWINFIELLYFVDGTAGLNNGFFGGCGECVGFNLNFAGYGAVAKDLHQIFLAYKAERTELLEADLLKILCLGQGLESVQIDHFVFHTIEILEAELGQTTLQRHLTAFETDFAAIA